MKKRTFDIIFIIVSALIITILIKLDFLEINIGFLLIPILIAYQIGQYSERKFKK
jgi:cytochrome c-type biogenesis protein CcmE